MILGVVEFVARRWSPRQARCGWPSAVLTEGNHLVRRGRATSPVVEAGANCGSDTLRAVVVTASRRELNVSALISGYYDEDPCRFGCRRLFVLFGGLARVLLVVVGYAYGALLSDSSATVGAVTECVESRKKLALGSGSPTVGKLYARELQVRTERRMGSGPS